MDNKSPVCRIILAISPKAKLYIHYQQLTFPCTTKPLDTPVPAHQNHVRMPAKSLPACIPAKSLNFVFYFFFSLRSFGFP